MKLILRQVFLLMSLAWNPLNAADHAPEHVSAHFNCVLSVNGRSYSDLILVSHPTSYNTPFKTACEKGLGFPRGSELTVKLLCTWENGEYEAMDPEIHIPYFWSEIRKVAPEYLDENLDTLPIGVLMQAFNPWTYDLKYVFHIIATVPKGVDAEPMAECFINDQILPIYSQLMLLIVDDINREDINREEAPLVNAE